MAQDFGLLFVLAFVLISLAKVISLLSGGSGVLSCRILVSYLLLRTLGLVFWLFKSPQG